MATLLKSVAFFGELDAENSITIEVNEDYCPLRVGKWQFRIESLSLTIKEASFQKHLVLSTNLLPDSPAFETIDLGHAGRKRLVLAPTPIHQFTVNSTVTGTKLQLIVPGQTIFEHCFNQASRHVTLFFQDVERSFSNKNISLMHLDVCGILLFHYLG